jgi:Gram-negative bacterial TonB protein C-terminal
MLKLLLLLSCVLPVAGKAQIVRTSYFKDMWEPAKERKYDIKRVISKTDSGYQITDYRKGDMLKFRGVYSAIDPDIPNGHFQFYNENGLLEAEGNYIDGELSGTWAFYQKDGSLREEVSYDLIIPVCDSSYTFNKEQYPATIDSSQTEVMPVFPGGNSGFYTFLYEQAVYPPLPGMYFKTGTVIGKFTIDPTGKVCDVHTEKGVDKDLRKEIMRVMLLLPTWEPGKKGDRPVSVKMTCPVTFNFQ